MLVDFWDAIKNSLRDVCTTEDALDTQSLQPVRNRVFLLKEQIKRV